MSDDPLEPTTEELRAVQQERAADERERARESESEADERAHDRRASKADYLAEKLAEQTRADEETER
jgi:hypothetical protein